MIVIVRVPRWLVEWWRVRPTGTMSRSWLRALHGGDLDALIVPVPFHDFPFPTTRGRT